MTPDKAAQMRAATDGNAGSGGIAKWPVFCHGPGWFRLLGFGVRHVDHRAQRPSFGERYGYTRTVHIGPHCFAWITRRR